MIDLCIGCGQGGARIAREFSEIYEVEGRYLNLTDVDFSKFDVPRSHTFILDEGGTGRDPVVGEQAVRKHFRQVEAEVRAAVTMTKAKIVLLAVGGGGGSGVGFLFPLLEYLTAKKRQVLLVFTLPQKREGLPAQPNALKALSRLIDEGWTQQVTTMLVDNDYCLERYGQAGVAYWGRVNRGIAFALRRFYNVTNLEKHKNYLDAAAGYDALDYREFLRILLYGQGFLDIREIQIDDLEDTADLTGQLRSASLLSGSMNINTTKAYIASVALPVEWRDQRNLHTRLDEVFAAVDKMTRTPYVLRSSYFNAKLRNARVSLLLAGVTRSHSLDKHLRQAEKNVAKYRGKQGVDTLDVSSLDFE